MGGSRVQLNKPHKSLFSSNSTRHLHKTSNKGMIAKSERNDAKGARAARIQRNKMNFQMKWIPPLDIPARKRFAKYRGLKSFRTSSWDPKESLPPEYARIFAFDNFNRTQKHVLAKALDLEQENRDDCVAASSYARLHIKEVPTTVASKLCMHAKAMPVIACGLLQHESKMSVLHFSIKKHDTNSTPIKAKEEFLFHVGFRQFVARPIYSTDNINSDKHKMERFLHAGRFSIASIYAPISFPPLPLIALKRAEGVASAPTVAAVGSLRSIEPDRIILKKIILTGTLNEYQN